MQFCKLYHLLCTSRVVGKLLSWWSILSQRAAGSMEGKCPINENTKKAILISVKGLKGVSKTEPSTQRTLKLVDTEVYLYQSYYEAGTSEKLGPGCPNCMLDLTVSASNAVGCVETSDVISLYSAITLFLSGSSPCFWKRVGHDLTPSPCRMGKEQKNHRSQA